MSAWRRRPIRAHPYTPSSVIPADHRGDRPCICGRARGNAAHDQEAVEKAAAKHAEQLRRIGEDQD